MIVYVKSLLRKIINGTQRTKIRRWKRHIMQFFKKDKKTTLIELERLLCSELGIKEGDKLIVSSSFGNLNAVDYSPRDVIVLLQSIVTDKGGIMMPYYPPMNSTEWAETNQVFDMSETKSGMGVLTNVFSKMPDVKKSIHPTKAVCCWGKIRDLVLDHEKSTTPFYWDSPYGKLLKMNSKSLCLGLKNIPIFHSFEDILSVHYDEYYSKEKKKLKVRLLDQTEIDIDTYVHDSDIIDRCEPAGDYVKRLAPKTYKRLDFGSKYVVCVDNNDLFNVVKEHFAIGDTRIKK
jgi:aminoglycoside 3-N-acetyltransferase